MTELLANPNTNDLIFINGACPVTYENKVTVAQRLKIRLLTFRGEWFLDTTVGLPYFQTILVRGVSKATIDAIFQEEILSDPDVVELVDFNSLIDVQARSYNLSFRVRTNQNQVTDYIDILLGV